MNINLQDIQFRSYSYSHTYSGGYRSTYTLGEPKPISLIDSTDFEALKKDLKGRVYQKLDPKDKVFFTKFSEFPRHKFRQYFDNPIVKKIESADAVIVNPNKMFSRYIWNTTYYELNDGTYLNTSSSSVTQGTVYSFTGNSISGYSNLEIPELILAKTIDSQKLVSDTDFLSGINSDGAELDEDNLDSIRDFLKSPTIEDVKIGMNMLSTLDYGRYGYKIAYMLSSVKDNLYKVKYMPNRACKFLMDSLDKDYSWRNYTDIEYGKKLMQSGDPDQIEFSKKIIKNYMEDLVENDIFAVSIDFTLK